MSQVEFSLTLIRIAFLFYVLFAAIGVFDGVYFHLVKFELHRREESRREHLIHVFRGFLLAPISYLLFVENSSGVFLLVACFLVAIDFGAEVLDIFEEKKSRIHTGSICMEEYLVHVAATSFRVTALVLMFVAKPSEAWFQDVPLPAFSSEQKTIGTVVAIFGICGVFHHALEQFEMRFHRNSGD